MYCVPEKRSALVFCFILLAGGVLAAGAQAVPSATAPNVSLTAGGMGSVFQPDFAGDWTFTNPTYPKAASSTYPLIGIGTYVDVRLKRWVQFEAEARWMRFNQYQNIYQDNYLIGPRLPVFRFGKSTVYAKGLAGFTNMNFDSSGDHGHFTAFAFGGGLDYKLTRRLSLRAIDVEYQYWPSWGNSKLMPYGASMGIGYKVF